MNDAYLKYIHEKFKNSYDVKHRDIQTDFGKIRLVFVDTICDSDQISHDIIAPLTDPQNKTADVDVIKDEVITSCAVKEVKTPEEAVRKALSGDVIIGFEFSDRVICCGASLYAGRAPDVPPAENVLKGSREGFSEKIRDNISMIRKRIKTDTLKCENMEIGSKSDTTVVIVYLEGVAPKKLVQRIKQNIKEVDVKYVALSNLIVEKLESTHTSFQTIGYTEKPDVLASKIAEGRVAILIDNESTALIAPYFFVENMQSPDDYSMDKYVGNYIRFIRWGAFLIATLLPGAYVALVTHHFSLIPAVFAFRLAVARAGVPYPIFIEIILMMFFFQLLREAGVRLPQQVGPAISIVGALILGDAAVQSGLSSTIAVLIVALTSISAFLVPSIFGSIAIWSDVLILFAALLGLPGYFIGFAVFCSHLAGQKTCGYPYLYPLGTMESYGFQDLLARGNIDDISKEILKDEKK